MSSFRLEQELIEPKATDIQDRPSPKRREVDSPHRDTRERPGDSRSHERPDGRHRERGGDVHERPYDRDARPRRGDRREHPNDRSQPGDRARDPPAQRHRSRSRSPTANGTRARSPPRGPRAETRRAPKGDDVRRPDGSASKNDDSRMDVDGEATDTKKSKKKKIKEDPDAPIAEVDPELALFMGFDQFRTTKNTKVPGNSRNYAVRKEKKTEYRQYMNRQGGFNRPLSPPPEKEK